MTSIDDQLTERANPWVKAVLWCVDDDSMSVVLQFNPAEVVLSRNPGFSGEGATPMKSQKREPTLVVATMMEEEIGPTRRRASTIAPAILPAPESDSVEGRTPGNYGKLFSSGGHNDTLTMTVWFDTTESDSVLKGLGVSPIFPDMLPPYTKSVLEDVEKLYSLTKPILAEHPGPPDPDKKPAERPPIVVFLWDKLRFSGAITAFSVTVNAFDKVGVARRASVTLTIEGRAFTQAPTGNEIADGVSQVKKVKYKYNTVRLSQVSLAMQATRRIRFT